MPYYRLYHLDPHTGHITSADESFAAGDLAALQEMLARQGDHPLELWDRGRKVGRTDAVPEAAAFVRTSPG